jgi:hypothetical protein
MGNAAMATSSNASAGIYDTVAQYTDMSTRMVPTVSGMSPDDLMAFLSYQLDGINDQFSQIANEANRSAVAANIINQLSAKLSKFENMDHRKDGNNGDTDKTSDNAANQADCNSAVAMIREAESQLPAGSPELAKLQEMEAYYAGKAADPGCIVNSSDQASQLATLKAMSDAATNNQNMEMVYVQQLSSKLSRMNEMVSNILHKVDESLDASVNNIK